MRRPIFALAILLVSLMAIGTVNAQKTVPELIRDGFLSSAEGAAFSGTNFQDKLNVLQAYLDRGGPASDWQTNENAAIAVKIIYLTLVQDAEARMRDATTADQGRSELNILAGNSDPQTGFRLNIPATIHYHDEITGLQNRAARGFAIQPEPCAKYDLVQGWDVQSGLSPGSFVTLCQYDRLEVTFEIHGALPNHEYTTGIAFFDLNPSANSPCTVSYFDGQSTASGCWSRDGQRLCSSYLNYAKFTTDGNGDYKASLPQLAPAKGSYKAQFYLRDGGNYGPQDGGPVAYHTGQRYGDGITVNVQ